MKKIGLWLQEASKRFIARVAGLLQKSVPQVVLQQLEGLRKLLAKWTDQMGTSGFTVAEAGRLGGLPLQL